DWMFSSGSRAMEQALSFTFTVLPQNDLTTKNRGEKGNGNRGRCDAWQCERPFPASFPSFPSQLPFPASFPSFLSQLPFPAFTDVVPWLDVAPDK
ncbi:hypothetical protein KUCAC02_020296, partial [Chaenocephalus aceratus]